MSESRDLPLSGYEIEKIYVPQQSLEFRPAADDAADEVVEIGWDWRLVPEEQPAFEVRLSATVQPSSERESLITATIVGRFRAVSEKPSVAAPEFVRLQAPAILLPYLRQTLTTLTTMSFAGPYFLPPLNVVQLMKDFDPEEATGAKQIRELAGAFGELPASATPSSAARTRKARKKSDV